MSLSKNIQIVDYRPEYREYFAELNRQWIEQYFVLEPLDRQVLNDPETHILSPGGYILFALENGEVRGTVALKREGEHVFELAKMAVDVQSRGKGIGNILLDAAIERARSIGVKKLFLYSVTRLKNAIHLYRKAGFTEIPVEPGAYDRCDIKMELEL